MRWTEQQFRDYQARMYGRTGTSPEDFVRGIKSIADIAAERESERESELQEEIEAYCRSKMWFVVRSGMHRRTSTPLGTPDFIIYADKGRMFTIETKSKTGKQTPEQLAVALMLEKLGFKVHIIRSFAAFLSLVTINEQHHTPGHD